MKSKYNLAESLCTKLATSGVCQVGSWWLFCAMPGNTPSPKEQRALEFDQAVAQAADALMEVLRRALQRLLVQAVEAEEGIS